SAAEVRSALRVDQRAAAAQPGAAVLDGRDIGTVVCPDADAKIYVTASLEARAERRFQELRQLGEVVIYERDLAGRKARGARDSARRTAPLRPADDAIVLDTTELDAE